MSQLQEYVDSQVATISPFKVKSQELLEQAKAKEVTDDATAKEAAQRKREQEIAEAEAAKAAKSQKPAVKSGIKTKTVFTVTNSELVPRYLCEPSDKLIREAIANGLREIPGVEIREEKSF